MSRKLIYITIMIFIVTVLPVVAQRRLQGGIQHAEFLPPLQGDLREGAILDTDKLLKMKPGNDWYRVPAWAVGTWESHTQTQYFTYEYKTGDVDRSRRELIAISSETCGWQKDSKGGVWEFVNAPYVAVVDRVSHYVYQLINYNRPVAISTGSVVVKFRSTDLSVDKETHEVLLAKQCESLQTYTPYRGNYVKVVSSIKTFDQDGKPLALSQNVSALVRVRGFEPWDKYKGRDMKLAFCAYLVSHGMADLVPAGMQLRAPAAGRLSIDKMPRR